MHISYQSQHRSLLPALLFGWDDPAPPASPPPPWTSRGSGPVLVAHTGCQRLGCNCPLPAFPGREPGPGGRPWRLQPKEGAPRIACRFNSISPHTVFQLEINDVTRAWGLEVDRVELAVEAVLQPPQDSPRLILLCAGAPIPTWWPPLAAHARTGQEIQEPRPQLQRPSL